MVNKTLLAPEERSRVYWFLSDCFLQAPTEISSEVWKTLQLSVDNSETMELRKEFTRLFRGIQEGYGPPPPYESLYRQSVFSTDITDAVISYFQSGGFDATAICEEAPDFLSSELRLMSLLAYKEYESSQNGNESQRQHFIQLQNEFLQHHLMIWVPEYCQILMEASRIDFYQQLASYLLSFLTDSGHNTSNLQRQTP
ncbi:MAG: molecular chaperone TorD family protein [Methylococcales bacterium]|nr:molecular chaperone TorD family protein [Methylococcales bacterium]